MKLVFNPRTRFQPANSRAVLGAQTALKALRDKAQQRQTNAIAVDGYPSVFYTRLRGGRTCSCSITSKLDQKGVSTPKLDDQGNAPPAVLHSLLTGSNFGIKDYGDRETPEHMSVPPEPGTVIEPGSFSVRVESRRAFNVEDSVSDLDDIGLTEAGALNQRCGCCYNLGWVGGFDMLSGYRKVFDVMHPAVTRRRLLIDMSTRPIAAYGANNTVKAEIELTVMLPLAPLTQWQRLQAWDNTDPVDAKWFILNNSNERIPITLDSMPEFCDGRKHTLICTGWGRITHVELQAQTGEPIMFAMPRLSFTTDRDKIDTVNPTQLTLGPAVPVVKGEDILADLIHGRLWRITGFTDFKDASGAAYGWEVDARIIQPYEALQNLYSQRNENLVLVPYTPPADGLSPTFVLPEDAEVMLESLVDAFNDALTGDD